MKKERKRREREKEKTKENEIFLNSTNGKETQHE